MARNLSVILSCESCGKSFHPHTGKPGRFCSSACSARSHLNVWRKEENDFLEKRCNVLPFPLLVKRLQDYQKRHGLVVRTASSIETQMKRLGLTFRCTLDNLNGAEMAEALGVNPWRVHNWKNRHGMPFYKAGAQLAYIPLKEFREWAAQHPHLLSDLSRENLAWVLGGESLADQILRVPPVQRGKAKPVRRDDGVVYPTIAAAARANFVTPTAIQDAMRRNAPVVCINHRFELA